MNRNEAASSFVLAPRPQSAGVARGRTRTWLDAIQCPKPIGDDIVYAVNEAVSNAIEHAYPKATVTGMIHVSLRVEGDDASTRRVRAEIRDHGRWRPPPADPGCRGRGIPLMEALMDELVIDRHGVDGVGTAVILTSPDITRGRWPTTASAGGRRSTG